MPTTTDESASADPGMGPFLLESREESLDSTTLADGDPVMLTSVEVDEYAAISDTTIKSLSIFCESCCSFGMDRELCVRNLSDYVGRDEA